MANSMERARNATAYVSNAVRKQAEDLAWQGNPTHDNYYDERHDEEDWLSAPAPYDDQWAETRGHEGYDDQDGGAWCEGGAEEDEYHGHGFKSPENEYYE